MDSGEESLDALEEVFERIQRVTGEDNLDLMVTKFLQGKVTPITQLSLTFGD